MKKSIILFGGLLFLTTQSCDVLDKEPLDSISTQQYFANANAQALEQYCNLSSTYKCNFLGADNKQ